jgi:molybdenum cofactor cytidylyltransferase
MGGKPMIRRTLDAILASGVRPIVLVTGKDADVIGAVAAGLPVTCHHAADYAEGMAASLKAGIAAVPPDCDGAFVCLGDMPFVDPATLDLLASQSLADRLAWVPVFEGQRGNPVLLSRALFPDLLRLTGDQGARKVLAAIPGGVGEVAVNDPGILRDIDMPDMLPS